MKLPSDFIKDHLKSHKEALSSINDALSGQIIKAYELIHSSITRNGTIFWCGNGGSASDCQHLAAELIGRYKYNRKPLKSLSLSTDTSVLTCISNDFSFESIFSRQLDALAEQNDVVVFISTSGNSQNILEASLLMKKKNIPTIGSVSYTHLTLPTKA